MQDSTFADIDYPDFSIFICKVHCAFMAEKENPVEKFVIDEEELDGIDIYIYIYIYGISNLRNIPRTVFID